jgi:hypothetical protein
MFGKEVCDCRCHDTDSGLKIRHIVACCYTCSVCQLKIRSARHIEHEKNCFKENGEKLPTILDDE